MPVDDIRHASCALSLQIISIIWVETVDSHCHDDRSHAFDLICIRFLYPEGYGSANLLSR